MSQLAVLISDLGVHLGAALTYPESSGQPEHYRHGNDQQTDIGGDATSSRLAQATLTDYSSRRPAQLLPAFCRRCVRRKTLLVWGTHPYGS